MQITPLFPLKIFSGGEVKHNKNNLVTQMCCSHPLKTGDVAAFKHSRNKSGCS